MIKGASEHFVILIPVEWVRSNFEVDIWLLLIFCPLSFTFYEILSKYPSFEAPCLPFPLPPELLLAICRASILMLLCISQGGWNLLSAYLGYFLTFAHLEHLKLCTQDNKVEFCSTLLPPLLPCHHDRRSKQSSLCKYMLLEAVEPPSWPKSIFKKGLNSHPLKVN